MSTRSSTGFSVPATREFLREKTAALHDQVDAAFGRFDIATRAGYRALLAAHARAVPAFEAALEPWSDILPDWPARTRSAALFADLHALGTDPAAIDSLAVPAVASPAAAFGVAYVLEGSRLGGKVIAKQLPADLPRAYLAARQPAGSWPSLMREANRCVTTTNEQEAALAAAENTFLAFREAALESVA